MKRAPTIDSHMFDADRTYTTRDGYTVRVTAREDKVPEASYGGGYLSTIENLCPGLTDQFDSEIVNEIPTSRRFVYSGRSAPIPTLRTSVALKLLRREQYARIPLRMVAEMMSAWSDMNSRVDQHVRWLDEGFEAVRVSVSRKGRLLAEREIVGLPHDAEEYIRRTEQDLLNEARFLCDEPQCDLEEVDLD